MSHLVLNGIDKNRKKSGRISGRVEELLIYDNRVIRNYDKTDPLRYQEVTRSFVN